MTRLTASLRSLRIPAGLLVLVGLVGTLPLAGQEVRIRDLTVANQEVPVRLVGYGLVTGLDGSGDRVIGGYSSGHTVRSIANLLRRFDVEVPDQLLRTRNVAAVLVTAEVSPYLRPGGRFEVQVSSVGDAVSLRGGVLWMTPLVPNPGAAPVATAQGALLLPQATDGRARNYYTVETSARIPDGGILEQPMATPDFTRTSLLYLREPNLGTAARIAGIINDSIGDGAAQVVDPGAVSLNLSGDAADNRVVVLSRIRDLSVAPERVARVVIDSRTGSVVVGGDLTVGEAVVSHSGMTLSVGAPEAGDPEGAENPDPASRVGTDPEAGTPGEASGPQEAGGASAPQGAPVPGDLRMEAGVSVQDVAAALHAVAAPPPVIGAVFESLRDVGAIRARVVIR
jgi:flagellar P-ring protein precursor FlgI